MSAPECSWSTAVVHRVNAALEAFFAEKRRYAARVSPAAPQLVEALAGLALRGGKRLRPATLHAGFCAVSPADDAERTLGVALALEHLQTYLLVQDDWMDGDRERRGGPAVHVALADQIGDVHLGAALAILAADLASGFAWEAIGTAPFPVGREHEGMAAFAQMHFEVVAGQQLDLMGHPDVARMHQLKTGSYTVRGPLRLGAILADAGPEQLAALERFGEPLGRAFQLRDDLLGAFGDRGRVGKPVGNDLKAGKHNSLIAALRDDLDAADRAAIDRVRESPEADEQTVARALDVIERTGARERVEGQLAQLLDEARSSLCGAPLEAAGVAMLQDLVDLLGVRTL